MRQKWLRNVINHSNDCKAFYKPLCNRQRVCNTESLATYSVPDWSRLSVLFFRFAFHIISLYYMFTSFPHFSAFNSRIDLIWYCLFYDYYIWIRTTENVLHNQIHNAHFQMIAFFWTVNYVNLALKHSKAKHFWTTHTERKKKSRNDKIYCLRINPAYTLHTP